MKRALIVATLAGMAALGWGFRGFVDAASAAPPAPQRRTDAIVVLTGGAGRVEAGLALLEAGAAPRLFISGTAAGLTLAELAQAHRRDAAALEGRVALGGAAITTFGNAEEVAAHVRATGARSLRIVTSAYHMPRATLELRRALPHQQLLEHPVAAPMQALPPGRRWSLLLSEYAKYLAAALGLTRLGPALT